ncbi:MAG: hypothetical protein H7327_09710 [Herminiimonas sp.]|nr:hypothetical protein [Herminiimonas sp.]
MTFAKHFAGPGMLQAEPPHSPAISTGDDLPLEPLRVEIALRLTAHRGTPQHFLGWMASLAHIGPGQQHALFGWLAREASLAQLIWVLEHESVAEANFSIALAAVLPSLPTMASRGSMRASRSITASDMTHTRLRLRLLRELEQMPDGAPIGSPCATLPSALAELMRGLSLNSRYAYHTVGAIAALDLGVPHRIRQVVQGLRRFGVRPLVRGDRRALPTGEDMPKSNEWLHAVVAPLVTADSACMQAIAEGALMSMLSGERSFDRYAKALQPEQFDPPVRHGARAATTGVPA